MCTELREERLEGGLQATPIVHRHIYGLLARCLR